MEISELLKIVVDEDASDLHLKVRKPPILRIHGSLHELDYPPLTPEDTEGFMKSITTSLHQKRLRELGNTDFGFTFGELARFRTAVFYERGTIGLSLRLIPYRLLTFEQLGLPNGIKELLYRPRGLVLVTGPTGSGKTTTLATMIDFINIKMDCHIITIEDPIEYFHENKKSIVTQRELGSDVTTFKEGLIRALRQDPDVILVGEMRDLVTMEAALMAAETGHLVFATLHTTGAAQSVDRVIDAFPLAQQEQARVQMASNIVGVISQQLIPKTSGKGRVAAFEIMVAIPAIQALIRERKTYRITSFIQTGARYGMMTMDDSLIKLYAQNIISYEETLTRCVDVESMKTKLQEMSKNES
ncbi:MAG: type IV pilus twitching motility protein PilT [Candidatus Omnitrophica bacterium]|nr:type IV pilus twitching motility protein PilT [Candidatus Omnitrophota bacterium]MBU1048342.1 type IV pilus twitching motility protein PilT [Candidatus Omnitrophota bacterium]MBU1766945.1 type IV pilus twitching motility protein PilT [Candidatus Omnitrophota bacterium]MBU1889676.1 type IV pilus twitching motility protein PilT [Candidatus Omnitrophota bacterium]